MSHSKKRQKCVVTEKLCGIAFLTSILTFYASRVPFRSIQIKVEFWTKNTPHVSVFSQASGWKK